MAKAPWNERDYRLERQRLRQSFVLCARCKRERAVEPDHEPPLALHQHQEGSRCCQLVPACRACNRRGGLLVQRGRWRPGEVVLSEPEPERDGLGADDRRWRVPWLRGLRDPPAGAVWPRLMTVPHPRAKGSLGAEFAGWAE